MSHSNPTQGNPANRFHVHVHVADIDANIRFYAQLFGAEPSVRKHDYAKWMLDDPLLNFAISTGKAGETGIAHLGLQAGSPDALASIGTRLQSANAITLAETDAVCCYARSDKLWAQDPQGLRWESFHTHGEATSYYSDPDGEAVERDSCCGSVSASSTDNNACRSGCGVAPADQIIAAGQSACCTGAPAGTSP